MKLVYNLLSNIGQISSYIYPHRLDERVKFLKSVIYSGYYKRDFGAFGKGSLIAPSIKNLLGAKYIRIGSNTKIGRNAELTAWDFYEGVDYSPEIIIGNNCSIGESVHISSINCVHIGDNVLMGKRVLISDNSHGTICESELSVPPSQRELFSKGTVDIGDNVWLCENCCIMAGVTIGKGAIIAANAVVTKDVPEYAVAAGVPARIVKQLR